MMRQILVPAAFIGGFLTAVIIGIKIIGVVNMLLISKVLMLNVAFMIGKLFYVKTFAHDKVQHHYYNHQNPVYSPYGSGSYASSFSKRADDSELPYRMNFYQPTGFAQNYNQIPNINNNFNELLQHYPTSQQQRPQFIQPPSNFQPQAQMNFIQPQNSNDIQRSNPFSGMQMQIPQQQQSAPAAGNQYRQPQLTSFDQFNSPQSTIRRNYYNNNNEVTSLSDIEMANLREIPTTISPLDILNDALARMAAKKSSDMPVTRFKRKSSNQRYLNLLKPFS